MKILTYTSPSKGHLYPLLPTLLELRRRGHQVAVRTLASEVELLGRLGLAAAPISHPVEAREMDDWRGKSQLAQLQRALNAFVERAKHEVPDLEQAIKAEEPDLILVDVNSWGAQAHAEAFGINWAVFAPYPLPIPSKDAPPFGLGLKPMGGQLGRLRDSALLRLSLLGWNKVLPQLNRVRASAGAAPLSSVVDVFGRAPVTIAYTAEPFEYPRSDWPTSVRLVGPSSWEPATQFPAWIQGLHTLKQPIVLVTTSTEYQGDDRLLQVALDALAGDPGDGDRHQPGTRFGRDSCTTERPSRGLRPARTNPRGRRVRRVSWWHGYHAEGLVGGSTRLRRAVWAGSARGRSPGGGGTGGYALARQSPEPHAPSRGCARGDDHAGWRGPHCAGFRGHAC